MTKGGSVAARIGWLTLSLGLVSVIAPAPAMAADVEVRAQIDGRALSDGTETKPIRLDPKRDSILSVDVTNRTNQPVTVRIVRLEGRVVGLTFFAYDTAVGLTVPANGQGSRRFTLDLGGLDGQATGLVPGAVKLLDNDRRELASQGGVVDVRGSLRSVYGLFGLGVAVLTVVSFLGCVVGLARHRLHPNRWRRAMRFLTPGLGLGLFLNFTLSATRVFVPAVGRWLTIVVICSAVSFGLGYLTPAPDLRSDEEMEEDEEERLALRGSASPVAVGAGAVAAEIPRAGSDTALAPAHPPTPELGPSVPRELTVAGEPASPATVLGVSALSAAPADDEVHQPTIVLRMVSDHDDDPGEPQKAPTTIVTEQ